MPFLHSVAADVNASAIPQWSFIVPNMVNNAHDTSVNFTSAWIEAWLNPLLTNQNFNAGNGTSGTLILLTFDENEVCCLLFGILFEGTCGNVPGKELYCPQQNLFTPIGLRCSSFALRNNRQHPLYALL